jgi:hypothetical protein
MVAMLALQPIRLKNFASLEIGRIWHATRQLCS